MIRFLFKEKKNKNSKRQCNEVLGRGKKNRSTFPGEQQRIIAGKTGNLLHQIDGPSKHT